MCSQGRLWTVEGCGCFTPPGSFARVALHHEAREHGNGPPSFSTRGLEDGAHVPPHAVSKRLRTAGLRYVRQGDAPSFLHKLWDSRFPHGNPWSMFPYDPLHMYRLGIMAFIIKGVISVSCR